VADPRRIVVVGATGVFGARLSRAIAKWPDAALVLAARRAPELEALGAALQAAGAANPIEITVIDRDAPADLERHRPWAVVDCAGPFQGSDYRLAKAALACGAHYLDMADGRAFVAGFCEAIDPLAIAAGRQAVTGASSTPALSHAAIDEMTRGWRRIDAVEAAIAPGARAPRGLSVTRAILSWVGRPVRVFAGGAWRTRAGWNMLRRSRMPGLGMRWLSLAETADLDLLPTRFDTRSEAIFLAGLEAPLEHLGLWLLSLAVRFGWISRIEGWAGLLLTVSRRLAPLGSDRGGMSVTARGWGPDGEAALARWSLVAEAGCGPQIPTLATAAMLRLWLDGPAPAAGAHVCVGRVGLSAILAQAADLPIRTRFEASAPEDACLARRLMGGAFGDLPASVRRVHTGEVPGHFVGRAKARGGAGLARLARLLAAMPGPGDYDLAVNITPTANGEVWTRRFGERRLRSRLRGDARNIGAFEESIGPLTFAFDAEPAASGYRWRFRGWRTGPVRLPNAIAPRIHARCFDRGGVYRFSVVVAHAWVGLIIAYAGWLEPPADAG
jgi:hypothetical protein